MTKEQAKQTAKSKWPTGTARMTGPGWYSVGYRVGRVYKEMGVGFNFEQAFEDSDKEFSIAQSTPLHMVKA